MLETDTSRRDALVTQLLQSATGALELFHVYIGDRLGLYDALAERPLTSSGLAATAGISERYAREWLEEQAVAGYLTAEARDGERVYSLPAAHAEVLVDRDSPAYLAALGRGIASIGAVMPQVLEAFRTGGGVPYELYGADMRDSISALNRPAFLNLLGTKWFPSVPALHARLQSEARVADVGCGTGWSSIAIATAYPGARVVGIDLDRASIEDAQANARAAGISDRVQFEVRDASDPKLAGQFDLVTAFETIHDMAHPVDALRAMRSLARPGAYVVVMDEKADESFSAPGDELQRFLYGWSAVHCLAVGMTEPDSAGTGTVMRPATLRAYARQAGFSDIEVLPIEHDSWRFYRLV
jgi:2-polyprenyl-3-methyl-5-hydroxy-6-metoxy-1,4-benzoquinol methylase